MICFIFSAGDQLVDSTLLWISSRWEDEKLASAAIQISF